MLLLSPQPPASPAVVVFASTTIDTITADDSHRNCGTISSIAVVAASRTTLRSGTPEPRQDRITSSCCGHSEDEKDHLRLLLPRVVSVSAVAALGPVPTAAVGASECDSYVYLLLGLAFLALQHYRAPLTTTNPIRRGVGWNAAQRRMTASRCRTTLANTVAVFPTGKIKGDYRHAAVRNGNNNNNNKHIEREQPRTAMPLRAE